MATPRNPVTVVQIPAESAILGVYPAVDLADAYSIGLPSGASDDPETIARYILSQKSVVVSALLAVRDVLVRAFGVKTSRQLRSHQPGGKSDRIGIFRIYSAGKSEIVLGEDDKHLDFRLSLMCCGQPENNRWIILSTVVHCHSRFGRIYIQLISPFHRAIVKAALRRAAAGGWPQASAEPRPIERA